MFVTVMSNSCRAQWFPGESLNLLIVLNLLEWRAAAQGHQSSGKFLYVIESPETADPGSDLSRFHAEIWGLVKNVIFYCHSRGSVRGPENSAPQKKSFFPPMGSANIIVIEPEDMVRHTGSWPSWMEILKVLNQYFNTLCMWTSFQHQHWLQSSRQVGHQKLSKVL